MLKKPEDVTFILVALSSITKMKLSTLPNVMIFSAETLDKNIFRQLIELV